jgi:putative salt-induced outer membrane protein YdiY
MVFLSVAAMASAQPPAPTPPPPPPPPAWDLQLGASFVGTSGNSDTSSTGADFSAHRRWVLWQIEATASAINTTDSGTQTAERYLGAFRGNRKLRDRLGLTSGIKLERDRLAGIDFRSILDGGLTYALVREALWTVDAVTALAWNHEARTTGDGRDAAQAVLQALSKYRFGTSGDTTQRFTFYPDFNQSSAYRSEAELTAQAALNKRLALKLGFLWRYSHDPVPGFERSDTTTTASIVVRWQAERPAP